MLTLKQGEESEWLCSKIQAILLKIYFLAIKKMNISACLSFSILRWGILHSVPSHFLRLLSTSTTCGSSALQITLTQHKNSCGSATAVMARPVVMDNYFNYHTGLNLAVFSKKAMKPQQWNNLPVWLLRSPFGAITVSCVVPSLWGTCGQVIWQMALGCGPKQVSGQKTAQLSRSAGMLVYVVPAWGSARTVLQNISISPNTGTVHFFLQALSRLHET